MKVLVVSRAGRGGIYQYAWQLCGACRRLGVEITLARPHASESLPGPGAARVVELGDQHGPRGYLTLARELVALASGYDLIHLMAPIWSPLDAAHLLARLRPVAPLSCTLHEVLPVVERFYHRPVYRFYWQGFDGVAVHSGEHERALRRLGASRPMVGVVPFGDHSESLGPPDPAMDPRRVLSLDAKRPVVLFFGLLQARKGLADLIRALAGTRGRVYLLLAGEPTGSLAAYGRLATELEVDLVLHPTYLRYLPGPTAAAALRAADVLALPYRTGGNSGVLAVACSMGIPVVATRAVAPPEYLRRLPVGAVVEPGDIDGLRVALDAVLQRGLAPPEPFPSWPQAARAYADFWAEVARSSPRRG